MVQPIRILSNDFEPLGQTEQYVSMMFTRSWHGIGEFDFVIHRDAVGADQIKKGTMLALDKNKVGIVRHREIQLDQNGRITENWLFKGFTLKGIMAQRESVMPPDTAYNRRSGDAETVMKHYVHTNFIEPYALPGSDPNKRIVRNLVIGPNQNRGQHIKWQSRMKNVSDDLEGISEATGLGWNITLDTDNNQFIFDVYEGKNLSVDNTSGNSPVYFSPEFGNVKQQSFTDSDFDMKNVAYVGGQGEGTERVFVEIGEAEGINRFETFIDARDIGGEDEDGNELTPEQERQLLIERGEQKMKEMENQMFFEAQIMSPVTKTTYKDGTKETQVVSPFIYEQHYDLGDITTIMNRDWGFIVDRRITELTEIHEANGFNLDVVFGQKRPTLISKIRDGFKQYENEIKR